MSTRAGGLNLDVIGAAAEEREAGRKRRARVALGVSVSVTVLWATYATVAGQWGRIADSWSVSVTMVFGSFVAGSTPQGSGAVAFPVFTKVLEVPSEVARSFSLSIQAIGMGTASLAIVINRRLVEWRAVVLGAAAALVGFVISMFLIGDPDAPFWPSTLPGPYVRVTFTLVLAAMAFVVYLGTRVLIRKVDVALPPMNRRLYGALVVAGLVGGLSSFLIGSGADVMIYLFVVVLFGVDPRVGVPTSVIVMALVSVLALLTLGVLDGQLDATLSEGSKGHVVAIGGEPITGVMDGDTLTPVVGSGGEELPSGRFDLFGMWIAAVPIVAWGAPLGSFVASRMKARHLVYFAISLAVAEALSTIIFLDALHELSWLLVYAVLGLAGLLAGLYLLAKYRRHIFGLPGLTLEESLGRGHLDVVVGYERQLRAPRQDGDRRSDGDTDGEVAEQPSEEETEPQ
jgi:uncharacterized protein